MVVEIYTDGACSGNPGPGGWGAVLTYRGREKEICGGEPATTNNRMELMAAIQALETLTRPTTVHLYTDSVYVRSGITSWLAGWKRNGWLTSAKQPVKNADLWQRLEAAAAPHQVQLTARVEHQHVLHREHTTAWRTTREARSVMGVDVIGDRVYVCCGGAAVHGPP